MQIITICRDPDISTIEFSMTKRDNSGKNNTRCPYRQVWHELNSCRDYSSKCEYTTNRISTRLCVKVRGCLCVRGPMIAAVLIKRHHQCQHETDKHYRLQTDLLNGTGTRIVCSKCKPSISWHVLFTSTRNARTL